jgi:hypothetical protein
MSDKAIVELNDLIEGALYRNRCDADGGVVFTEVYHTDGMVTAGTYILVEKGISWMAEVSIRADLSPIGIGEPEYRGANGFEDWRKVRGRVSGAIRRKGEALREHLVRLRDGGHFTTPRQSREALASLKALVTAVNDGTLNDLAEAVTRSEAILAQLDPGFAAAAPPSPSLR